VTPTIRLGRLFGIEIGFNWSLLFVFALIAWTLAGAVLPAQVPKQPLLAYWVIGLAGATIFYVCLLAHELAHALMARRSGVKVAGITLWLFGGVSQLVGEPQSAGAEALITAVGPLTSMVVAGTTFALGLLTSGLGAPHLVSYLMLWLAFLNLVLAVFNLVPAFPLDGGRLLSSFFWWRTGSRQRGVHNAVRVGRIVAALMIAFGVVELLMGAVLSGIWIAFIGWFLLSAASAEESASQTRTVLKSVLVSEAMTSPVVTVPDWVTAEDFVRSLAPQHHFTTYPLRDLSGRLTGLVRLQELLRAVSSGKGAQRLREVARPIAEVPKARPQESLEQLLERVGSSFQLRVLVFEGEELVGILSPADVSRIIALRQAMASSPNVAA
jgi:Zn-dependent protease/CBS domain-containing protein